jgi:predicted DNA-binding ArsR family transcriptional regulator
MTEKEFNDLESKIVEMIGSDGTFANDVSKELNVSSLTLKGLVRRSVKFDFKGHNIVPLKEEE